MYTGNTEHRAQALRLRQSKPMLTSSVTPRSAEVSNMVTESNGGVTKEGPRTDLRPKRATHFARELGDRKLVQWLIGYLAGAWVVLQLTDALREIWSWPVALQQGITLVLGLGLLPTLVLAWYHGEKGRQDVCACELALLVVVTFLSTLLVWSVCL